METQTYVGVLVVQTCVNCGIVFGLDRDYYYKVKASHESFCCPKGHSQYFKGKSEAEKLKEELAAKDRRIEAFHTALANKNTTIQSLNYSNRALKAAKTKVLNRVKNGVCPCCNRTFTNLQQHFKTVHPEILSEN